MKASAAPGTKAVSPFITMVFTILFGVTMLAIILNTVNPLFNRATDASVVNDALQNLELVRSAIESVASEAQGSTRTVPLSVQGGTYRVDSSYDWLYFEYDPQEALQLSGQRGNVYVRQGFQFGDWFDSYASGAASSAGWTNVSGTWTFSDYKYSGANGTAYHNVSGPLTNWKFSASIANVSGATGGEVFALPGNPESLVGYWTADEASGNTFYDWSGNGNTGGFVGNANGTTSGMAAPPTTLSGWSTSCMFNGCLQFDGNNDIVTISNMSFPGEFTVSFWAYRNRNADYDMVVGSSVVTAGVNPQKIGFNSGNDKLFVRVVHGGSSDASVTASSGTWTYVVIRRDANNKVDAFVSGGSAQRLFSDVAQIGLFSVDRIGVDQAGNYFNGTVDDLKMWSRALSDVEISSEYSGVRNGEALSSNTNTTGLAGWWKFNEGDGTSTADDSTRAYGQYAGATRLDGTNDYVNCGNVSSSKSPQGAVSFWIRANSFSGGSGVIHIYEASITDYLRSYADSNGILDLVIEDDNIAKVNLDSVTTLQTNTWYHIVWTQDGTGVKLYMNGAPASVTGTNSGSWWTDHLHSFTTKIGLAWAYFNGTIDEVMVFNRSLSADDVASLYETSAKKISGAGGSQNIGVETPNPAIVFANPAGTTRFDSVEVTDMSSRLTLLIPFSDVDLNGTLRAGKGEHILEVRNMGVNATSSRPMVQLTAS